MKTWHFQSLPSIVSSSVAAGPFEKNSPYADYFDTFFEDLYMEEKSFEKAQRKLLETSVQGTLQKAGMSGQQVDCMIAGDLINQITPSNIAARTLGIPYLGVFSACASSMEGLALAGALVDAGYSEAMLTGVSSHNAATEKQFRYPTEYGGQKPPTAQWTVTAAGSVLVTGNTADSLAHIEKATIGRVQDINVTDPFNMGAAMSLAAADTIERHFNQTGESARDYDLIITGDLAAIGHAAVKDILNKKQIHLSADQFLDCGKMIYQGLDEVQAGGSGPACSAAMVYGYFLKLLKEGTVNKVLVVATGALLSPLTFQQKESIPCIAHAVSLIKPQKEGR
ncbi:stage V sporulation protein AD [Jeotgalibacillus alimentarius]|uniref:Stage V sporulation protein AD n=1 Tax=Jeotgalibacillus alimentarius TaxID=135826 RepID=A0A0C2S880_9BACL|nr:stage V sporulation protein AD [Jeotgalibacillus alimentarius]KIL50219.1 stage V sporulation protein AD [Jeotgalibacillus alimentarius]